MGLKLHGYRSLNLANHIVSTTVLLIVYDAHVNTVKPPSLVSFGHSFNSYMPVMGGHCKMESLVIDVALPWYHPIN